MSLISQLHTYITCTLQHYWLGCVTSPLRSVHHTRKIWSGNDVFTRQQDYRSLHPR